MRTFLSALSFLTILRTPGEPIPPGRDAALFPLVGAILGTAGAGVYLASARILPVSIAALLTVAFWTTISGVLHEDGLADVADALRAGRTQETMLRILKDSRIGAFGTVAILLSVLVRWQALEHAATTRMLEICIIAQSVPRAAMVALAWISRPVGTGLGLALSSTLTTPAAVAAIIQGVVAVFIAGWRPGLVIVAGTYLVMRGARSYFYRRIGGVNGDCLGATEQVLECFVLIVFAIPSLTS